MSIKKSLSILIVLILLIGSVFFFMSGNSEEETEQQTEEQAETLPQVEIEKITNTTPQTKLSKLGKVVAEEKTTVIAEVSGRITNFEAELGEKVIAGQIIAQLGNSLSSELLEIDKNTSLEGQNIAANLLTATQASTQKEIEVMQNNVDNALISYQNSLNLQENTQKLLKAQIHQAEIALVQAKTAHNNNKSLLNKTADASFTSEDNNYDSLLRQTQTALAHLEVAIDTGDLLFAQKNSKHNALRGQLKQKNDYSSVIKTEHNFIKALDEIEDVREIVNDAEKHEYDAHKVKYAAHAVSHLIDKVEKTLIEGDNYLQNIRIPNSLGLDAPITEFNSKFPGQIASLNADRNSLQATINGLKSTKKNNQVQITNLQGQVDQSSIQIKNAYNALKQSQINAQSQLDNLSFQVETARNQYESSKAQLDSLTAKMQIQELQAKNSLNQASKLAKVADAQSQATQVKAPISGSITNITLQEGQLANQGQTLLTIESTDKLKIETTVTEKDLEEVKFGTTVSIKNSQGFASEGVITKVSDAQDGAKLFPIEITITNNNNLKSGTFVRLEFSNEASSDEGFFIPLKSVLFSKNKRSVYVVNSKGEIEEKDIKVRRIIDKKIEVISGLEADDQLIIDGGRQLNPGDKVEIAN